MRILITGALGHIGSRLIRELPITISNPEFILIDNLSSQRYCSLFNLPDKGKYRFIEDDLLSIDLSQTIDKVDLVIHLAAITDATSSFKKRKEVTHVNFNTTAKVAKFCEDTGCPMIHLSSTSVYGSQKEQVDENCSDSELNPQSPYAETKLREEKFLQKTGKKGGLRFITCRFGTICGPSPGMRFHTAVNKFCWHALIGKPLTVWRTALYQKRPYLAIDDAIKAIEFIISNKLYDNGIYNVVTENHTVNSIIQLIKKRVPKLSLSFVDTEIMNQLSYEVLTFKFQKLGFTFNGSIEKCIDDTFDLLQG